MLRNKKTTIIQAFEKLMKKLTATTSSFATLITEGFLYVDKTQLIYNLIAKDRYYFLSRPRRFGKTLLISTLKELFSGNKALFKGLWIDSSDYAWEQYPVISLNFSTLDSSSAEDLKKTLAYDLDLKAKKLSIDLSMTENPGAKLKTLVESLAEKNKVVILIDEYDYPIIHNVHKPEVIKSNLEILSTFFTAIKGLDEHLRAIFITGVSQIPKASIFSGLNNLNNISLDPTVATLLGYTKEEINTYFSSFVNELAHLRGVTQEELENKIQQWYNGYRFSKKEERVYNPFSLHYLFTKQEFDNYWFNSGTPSFLIQLLKKNNYILEDVEHVSVFSSDLSTLTIGNPQLISLLFQTGYLTISSYDAKTERYTLTYPNHEVRESYSISLIAAITDKDTSAVKTAAQLMTQALNNNEIKTFCSLLGSLFAYIPYQIDKRQEAHYHSMMHLFILSLGFDSQAEVSTNKGRIDLVVQMEKFIYIFEVKVDTTAEKALEQIEDRMYYEQFLSDEKKRTIVLVGLAFNKYDAEAIVSCACKTIDKAR